LRTRGVGTEAAVETAELASSAAKQAVLSSRQSLQQADARVAQAKTLIERRQITLTNAERLLADTEIYAGFDGRLSDVQISAGGIVSPNERLAQLVDPDALEVSLRVSTAQYTRLLDADGGLIKAPVSVILDVLGTDLTVKGRLSRESAAVAEGTTGRVLFASIATPGGLRPGDFVTVAVDEPELDRVVKVPAAAVGPDETVLVLGEDDRLEVADVQILRRQGDDVIIRARGLRGREIVSERSQLLGAGIKVKPLRGEGAGVPEAPEMLTLDAERKAKLIAFVEANTRIPDAVRQRMLTNLAKDQVPAQMVQRLEQRMGS
jgi:RND family efflux transporter MFP subunit